MSTHKPTQRFALLVSIAVLMTTAIACSSDADGSPSKPRDPAGEVDSSNVGGADGSTDRPFGVGRQDLAYALATATGADSHDVDGNVILLRYDEGSKDDSTAMINCSVALSMKDPADHIEMTYPDGVMVCVEE